MRGRSFLLHSQQIKLTNYNLSVENRGEVNNHEHNNNAEITLETQSWENQQIMDLVWL